jgi:molecular chaperone DnaJ
VAAKRDYYEVLGVERGADEEAIRTAYRKLALQHHPDRNPGDASAEEKFKEATEAYEVLKDPERRARYDRLGHEAAGAGFPGGGMGGAGFEGFDLADALRAFMRDFGGGGGGFEDLFGPGGGDGTAARRGNDLRVRLRLSLEEIATGVKKTIQVKRKVSCETCQGSGAQKGGKSTCAQCGGRGQVRQVRSSLFGQFVNIGPCPKCRGTGSIIDKPCLKCRGEGRLTDVSTISVDVPAGVAEGNYIPLRGLGDAGLNGGPAGDLQVHLEEKEHDVFEREGDDLHVEVPIAMSKAALGGPIEVPLLGGETKAYTVPAGTPTGKTLRLSGNGLPRLRGRGKGDLFVHLRVWTPTRLSARGKQLFEELARLPEESKVPKAGKSLLDKVKGAFGG